MKKELVFTAVQDATEDLDAWTWTKGAAGETEMKKEASRKTPNLTGPFL